MTFTALILGTIVGLLSPNVGAPSANAGNTALTVHLRTEAVARGLQLRLADIADLDAADPQQLLSASTLVLDAAPAPGEGRMITREHLASLLKRTAPRLRVALGGAEVCRVRAEEVLLSSEEVALLARRAVAQRLGSEAADARISVVATAPRLRAPAGRFRTEFIATVLSADPLPARVRVQIRALVDGVKGPAVEADIGLATEVTVVQAARVLLPGRGLSTEDVKFVKVSAAALPQAPLASTGAIIGLMPKARIEAGRVLQLSDFRRNPVVLRGDPVIVEVVIGALTVRSEGVAQDDGAAGERVSVKTRNKTLIAEVVDARTVRVAKELSR